MTIGLIVGVVAIFVGAWALDHWQPFADDDEAASWPDNVEELAFFVERTTGLTFDRPVDVDYIVDDADYVERVEGAWGEPSRDAETWAEEDEAFGRALGLWATDIDLYERLQALEGADTSSAWWLFDDETLVVNAAEDDDSLSVDVRVSVVSALTEALLDEHYDLQSRADDATLPQEWQVVVAMDGGHAQWVTLEFLATLDADEVDDLNSSVDPSVAGATAQLPAAYKVLRLAASQGGTTFFEALHEEPLGIVDEAYTTEWPDALDQISLPDGKFLTRDQLEAVDAPKTPSDGEFLRARQLGPVALFLMIAASTDARDALTASDGWGNDATTMYSLDGRICADSHIVADSPDDADLLEAGLGAWAYDRPEQSDVLIARDGVDLFVSVCDPDVDVRQPAPSTDDGDQYIGRMQAIQTLTAMTGQVAVAECAAVQLFAEHSAAEATEIVFFDLDGALQVVLADCAEST